MSNYLKVIVNRANLQADTHRYTQCSSEPMIHSALELTLSFLNTHTYIGTHQPFLGEFSEHYTAYLVFRRYSNSISKSTCAHYVTVGPGLGHQTTLSFEKSKAVKR